MHAELDISVVDLLFLHNIINHFLALFNNGGKNEKIVPRNC